MNLQQQLRNGWLIVLKYTLNPLTCRLARSSFGPFTIVRHVGRRSGKQRTTPVLAFEDGERMVLVASFGAAAWFRVPAPLVIVGAAANGWPLHAWLG